MKKIILITLVVFLAGCGYSINKPGDMPGNVKTTYVTVFNNLTTEVGLETIIATSLVSEIARYDSNAVSASSANADAVIKGTIRSESSQSISRHGVNVAAERLAILYVDVQLVKPNGQILWQVQNLTDNEPYLVFDDKMSNEASRYNAYSIVAARLAERIYEQMTYKF